MNKIKNYYKKGLSLLLVAALTVPAGNVSLAKMASGTERNNAVNKAKFDFSSLKKGTYKEGEVIVKYRSGALDGGKSGWLRTKNVSAKSTKAATALKKVRADENVSDSYGAMEKASGSVGEVVSTADEQKRILEDSLEDDFVLEDTVSMGDSEDNGEVSVRSYSYGDLNFSLVSSDKYDTKELISLLSDNDDIEYVEPNYYVEIKGIDDKSATGGINDEYADNMYNVDYMNADAGWEKLGDDTADEAVVAVIDSGVDITHPDLKDRIWTNPGNIGLEGEHGYNFYGISPKMTDDNGHGTHCAGIIAASSDNAIGTSGVAGKANVKIMPLKILGADGTGGNTTVITNLGAFNYVLQAKKRGVNVVATSNSWGASGNSLWTNRVYDDIFNALGACGIMNIFAAGNATTDLENTNGFPTNANSDYITVIGSMDEYGKVAGYSNYGRTTVDIFAPGSNILSTYNKNVYNPAIYSADKLKKTTDVYGEFSDGATVSGGEVTPVTGDDGKGNAITGVKTFGKSKVILPEGSEASYELEVVGDKYFNASTDPSSLKVSFKNVKKGEDLYIYFPYEKNKVSSNNDISYSIMYRASYVEDGGEAYVYGGEVFDAPGEAPCMYGGGAITRSLGKIYDGMLANCTGKKISCASEIAEGVSYGLGLNIKATKSGDLELYIDSLGISKRVDEKEFGKYTVMSGTSMACPAAAGAYALLSRLYPDEGYEDKMDEYPLYLKEKFLSLVTRTDEFEDICSTGGYIDFSGLDKKIPSITKAKVDTDKWTITLRGANLDDVKELSYRRMAKEGAEYVKIDGAPKDGMYYELSKEQTDPAQSSEEKSAGKNVIIIHNAKELVGTYTRFKAANDEADGVGSFFLVDGENAYETLSHMVVEDETDQTHILLSDGTNVYGAGYYTGDLYVYKQDEDGNYNFEIATETTLFDDIRDSNIPEYFKSSKYGEYNEKVSYDFFAPMISEDFLSEIMVIHCGADYMAFLAEHILYNPQDKWIFTPIRDMKDLEKGRCFASYDSDIYCIGGQDGEDDASNKVYKLKKDEDDENYYIWEDTKTPMNMELKDADAIQNGKYLYVLGGYDKDGKPSNDIQRFDGKEWITLNVKLPADTFRLTTGGERTVAAVPVDDGFVVLGDSADGYGDTYFIDINNNKVEPIYYSMFGGLSDSTYKSAAVTKDGIYIAIINCYDFLYSEEVLRLGCGEDTFKNPYIDVKYNDLGLGRGTYYGPGTAHKGARTYFFVAPNDEFSYVDKVSLGDGTVLEPDGDRKYSFVPTDDAVTINVEWGKHTEKVEFTRKTEFMYAGSSFKFQAESDGTNSDVTYSTSNEDYAVIDEKSGLMTVNEAGIGKTIEVYATSVEKPNLRDVCEVLISAYHADSISFEKNYTSIAVGEEIALSVVISPENTTNKNVTYKSSDESLATVSETGVVKALEGGAGKTVYITAVTENGMKAVMKLEITAAKPSASATPEPTATVSSSAAPSDGATAAPGTGTTLPSASPATNTKTKTKTVAAKSIKFKKIYKKLKAGKKITLKVIIKPSNVTNKKVTYKTSNKKYATVSKKGVVKVKKAGIGKKVTITAKTNNGKKVVMKIRIIK